MVTPMDLGVPEASSGCQVPSERIRCSVLDKDQFTHQVWHTIQNIAVITHTWCKHYVVHLQWYYLCSFSLIIVEDRRELKALDPCNPSPRLMIGMFLFFSPFYNNERS